MAWYWPKIEDAKIAQNAALEGVGVGLFITAVTSLAAILSIVYHKSVLGIDGGALFDAALFALVSWRIYKMSRPWAVIGLLLYLFEVAWRVAKHVGSSEAGFSAGFSPVAVAFILAFVHAVRGTFAFHRFRNQGDQVSSAHLVGARIESLQTNRMTVTPSPNSSPAVALAGTTTAKSKVTAVLFFAIALLLWGATITHNALGFVAPMNAEAVGGDLWVALMWLMFLYASRKLYRTFWKSLGALGS